jgi:DNA-3-methyladenine glycosylase
VPLPPPLPADFYEGDVVALARAMIGKLLVHASSDGVTAGRIVETEAYRGPLDLAAHSAGGRRTRRTEAMFGPAGTAYMFLLYGTSWAFNVVAGARESPEAVLVRALEPVELPDAAGGLALMETRREVARTRRELTNGPGKLCQAMGLGRSHYACSLLGAPLYLANGHVGRIGRSPRINVDYAGAWAARRWRFYERGNRYVSVRPRD